MTVEEREGGSEGGSQGRKEGSKEGKLLKENSLVTKQQTPLT
jgi:hypothetical protein